MCQKNGSETSQSQQYEAAKHYRSAEIVDSCENLNRKIVRDVYAKIMLNLKGA
jgi:hypothetical protein